MIGAIAGDIIGLVYEHRPIKTKDFPLFHPRGNFTDDTVLTVALEAGRDALGLKDHLIAIRVLAGMLPPCPRYCGRDLSNQRRLIEAWHEYFGH